MVIRVVKSFGEHTHRSDYINLYNQPRRQVDGKTGTMKQNKRFLG